MASPFNAAPVDTLLIQQYKDNYLTKEYLTTYQ